MKKYEYVAKLIFDVLSSKITVQDALKNFPDNSLKDVNIKSAFDALMHLEADEDIRKKDPDYADFQNDYLEYIAATLANNQALPNDVVKRYCEYHKDNLISGNKKGFLGFIEYIIRIINF